MPASRPLRLDAISLALLGAAIALAVSLFLTWRAPEALVVFGAVERLELEENGFERWRLLDPALLVLAASLAVTALLRATARPLPRPLLLGLVVLAVLALLCVAIAGLRTEKVLTLTLAPGIGVWIALAALLVAIVALGSALRPGRRRTAL